MGVCLSRQPRRGSLSFSLAVEVKKKERARSLAIRQHTTTSHNLVSALLAAELAAAATLAAAIVAQLGGARFALALAHDALALHRTAVAVGAHVGAGSVTGSALAAALVAARRALGAAVAHGGRPATRRLRVVLHLPAVSGDRQAREAEAEAEASGGGGVREEAAMTVARACANRRTPLRV